MTAMVVNTRALLLAVCCALSVAACAVPNGQAANGQSNQSSANLFNTGSGGVGGGGSGGY